MTVNVMTSGPLHENPEFPRGMEAGEVPDCVVGRLEAHWTGVLERVKKQSEARHSKEGVAGWSAEPLSTDDSPIDANNVRIKT